MDKQEEVFKKNLTFESLYTLFQGLDESVINAVKPEETLQFEQRIDEKSFLFTIKKNKPTSSLYVYGSDITERKKAEKELERYRYHLEDLVKERTEKLKETKDSLENIIESSLDCIVVTDSKGYITRANNSFMKLLGYKEEEVIGKHVAEFSPAEGGIYECTTGRTVEIEIESYAQSQVKLMERLYEDGKISNAETYYIRKDRKLVHIEVNNVLLYNEKGDITGAVGISRDITERKKFEKEVKMSEERYRSLIEHANDAILCTNKEGIIISFNKKAVEMFGYAPEEIVGQSVVLLSPPSKRERQKKLIEKLQTSNELYIIGKTMEGKGIRKDGQEFPYEGSTFKLELQGEFVLTVMLRDISERKKKEEELVKIRTALDNSSDAIAMTDINLNIVYQNQAFLNLFGYTVDEIDRNEIPHVYKDINVSNAVLQAIKSGERWEGEIRTLSKDGRECTCLLSTSPILDDTGNIIGYFSIHTDITDRKRMELQLLQSEKLKSLGELAGGVAHDFNNVLAAILGRAQLLKMIVEPPPGKEEKRKSVLALKKGLEVIEQASLDGAETVRRIQEFARRRDEDKYFTTINLNEIIENALEFTSIRWKNDAESKGIKINIQKELSPIPGTSGSATELREVFTNLINNAIDAMPQGGSIKIKTLKENNHISIKVEDTGVGISEVIRNRIFDPFFTTKGVQSTGLGMSVSYGIINRHRGTITVDSVEGKGTAFIIKLPISEKAVKEEKEEPISDEQKKARILVVEDEKNVSDLLSAILTKGGHEVEIASDGSNGIKLFKKKEFDMVFTDLGMPGMSGWQVAEKVKSINKNTPVALITGWNVELKESEMRESGVDLIVNKPFEVNQVFKLVQDAMILKDRFKAA